MIIIEVSSSRTGDFRVQIPGFEAGFGLVSQEHEYNQKDVP